MFIVKNRNEVIRFGLFLLLVGVMAFFVASRLEQWRLSQLENEVGLPVSGTPVSDSPGLSVEASAMPHSDGRDYFAVARMDRSRTRDAYRETLKEVMDNPTLDAETRRLAGEQYLAVGQIASREATAENLLRGKGYEEVLVTISDGSAQVVVKAPHIDEAQARQIADTVARVTGLKLVNIQVAARER